MSRINIPNLPLNLSLPGVTILNLHTNQLIKRSGGGIDIKNLPRDYQVLPFKLVPAFRLIRYCKGWFVKFGEGAFYLEKREDYPKNVDWQVKNFTPMKPDKIVAILEKDLEMEFEYYD